MSFDEIRKQRAEIEKEVARMAWSALRGLSTRERETLRVALSALYFRDSSDYEGALWSVLRALLGAETVTEWEEDLGSLLEHLEDSDDEGLVDSPMEEK